MPPKQTAPTPAPSPKDQLKAAYDRFVNETNPARKLRAGKRLIRVVFGEVVLEATAAEVYREVSRVMRSKAHF